MGKLHSKLSSKSRQSPEGGVLVSNLLNSQREVELIPSDKEKLSMNMPRDVQRNNCRLSKDYKVTLPPKQGLDKCKHSNNEHTHSANQERNTFTDNPKQEWLFTTESGNSNEEDMSNFLHGVCKVIDASVKPTTDSTTTLKIKIVLSSSDDQHKEKKQCPSEEAGRPMRRLYCAGENIERRNHYLDLAGIENFTSKFDDEDSTNQKRSSHHHHLVATSDTSTQKDCHNFSTQNSLRTRPVWKEEKSSRLHGPHPASLCRHHSSSFRHVTNGMVHRSHSKRLRPHTSPRRPVYCYHQGGKDCYTLTSPQPPSPAVRHDHHHLHEHHHHHHHHYHAA